jgi:hypothetical protein
MVGFHEVWKTVEEEEGQSPVPVERFESVMGDRVIVTL